MRYTRYEAKYTHNKNLRNKALRLAFLEILNSIRVSIFKKRCFLVGWDGIALMLGYLSYFIMKFLYLWDLYRQNGDKLYPEIRKSLDDAWKTKKI